MLQSRTVWAIAAMTFCYIMISGFMYVQLEAMPFYKIQDHGVIEWFHTYFEEQWAVEIYIVSAINAIIALGMILIIEAEGGVKETSSGPWAPESCGVRGLIQSVVGLLLVCAFFALMMSVYAIKNWGYPYSYPLTDIWEQD